MLRGPKPMGAGPTNKQVIKCGTLLKRAQGKSLIGRTNWKERYFVLQDGQLSYWDTTGSGVCKGVIQTSRITAVENVGDATFLKTHMFQIVHSSILYLKCYNEQERDEWVALLREECSNNELMHRTFHPGMFDGKHWSCCGMPSADIKGCEPAHNYSTEPAPGEREKAATPASSSVLTLQTAGNTTASSSAPLTALGVAVAAQ
eukprot:m.23151 g.23151  ORF g.23151 m.23151 type:complete len:203 (+) comp7081_c0_seq1:1687-2295(+)